MRSHFANLEVAVNLKNDDTNHVAPMEGVEHIAAFFDLDGTLLPLPSLEKRFFRTLRYRHAIGVSNYLLWLAEAARLLPRGINQILYADKMHLRGVSAACSFRDSNEAKCARHEDYRAESRRAKLGSSEAPQFYPEALERLGWHAKHGHATVIVSGTLQPLAVNAAAALEELLAGAGIRTTIGVYATRLETRDGKWTGRLAGEAMFGQAKARAIKQIAASRHFDLEKCFAYGDSANDRWLLESVGRPTAINPSIDLARIAARNAWPILQWKSEGASAQSSHALRRERIEPAASDLHAAQSKPGTLS